MIGLYRSARSAIPAAAAVLGNESEPFRRRVRPEGADLAGSSERSDYTHDLRVRPAVRDHGGFTCSVLRA
jgi:hypothetical protein